MHMRFRFAAFSFIGLLACAFSGFRTRTNDTNGFPPLRGSFRPPESQ